MSMTPHVVAVYGALRSGTTLFRLMLDQNSQLKCPGEADFLFDHLVGNGTEGPVYDLAALKSDRIFRANIPDFEDFMTRDISLDRMLRELADTSDVEDTTLVLMLHRNLARMLHYLPDMKIIHFVRDPRDVARSSIGMGWAGTTYDGIRHWLKTEGDWARCKDKVRPENTLFLQYEELIENPEATLRQVCNFLDVRFEQSMLDLDKVSSYSKPDTSLTFQWKHKQTPREVGHVEARVGPLLADLNYAESGYPPIHPGLLERIGLAARHKQATWAHRIKRYGLRDPVLVALSRRLRWPELGRTAQSRIDVEAEKHLR